MITVLVLAAVTAVIAASFLSRSAQEAKLASRALLQSAALNLAEAGVEEALYGVNTNTVNSANGWTLATGSTTDYVKSLPSGFTFPGASGAVYIRIDNAKTTTPVIFSTGVITIPNQPKILKQLRVTGAGPSRLWGNSVVAKNLVTFSSNSNIDSYDSNLGPWNSATNRSDRATVASNATVQLTGSATIYGYVATGGAMPDVGSTGRIYGATSPSSPNVDSSRVRTDFNQNLLDAVPPTGAAYALGSLNSSTTLPRAGDTAGPDGRYVYTCTSIALIGTDSLSIKGPVDLIVSGNVTLTGSALLSVGGAGSTDPSLNLFGAATINVSGSGMLNQTGLPASVAIVGTAPSGTTQSVTITGSGALNGVIYAPNADVTLGGSGDMYGAIVGKTVTVGGSGILHYDVQLANKALGQPYVRVGAWSELTGAPGGGSLFARDNREPFAGLF